MKNILPFLLIVFLVSKASLLKSQTCGTCSTNITALDSANYTINSGETFCVDTTGNFVGSITLNGGTICNKGLFNPKTLTFTSGTLSNYANVSLKSTISIGGSSTLSNNLDAIMNIKGNLTNSGGSITNNGIINVDQNVQNNSGTFTNTSVVNCIQQSGSGTMSNTGIINSN